MDSLDAYLSDPSVPDRTYYWNYLSFAALSSPPVKQTGGKYKSKSPANLLRRMVCTLPNYEVYMYMYVGYVCISCDGDELDLTPLFISVLQLPAALDD